MSWSNRFEKPVELPDGSHLLTLRQAAQYILMLSKAEHDAEEWRTAMRRIIEAADHGGQIHLARTELLRAIQLSCSGVSASQKSMNMTNV